MEDNQVQTHEIEEKIKKAWGEIVKMEERLNALPGQVESFNQSLQEMQQTLNNSKDQISSISAHYADYFAKTDPAIKTKLEMVVEHHAAVEQFLRSATDIKKELEEFKDFIFGNETLGTPGFKKNLETLFENNKVSNEKLIEDWKESYKTLYGKIEGLLPGATATGLSKAYQEQNKDYKWPVNM